MSFRRCRHGLCGVYGQHWGGPEGDAFGRAARRFEEMGLGALLINCIPPDHVDGMVSFLRDFTDLPLGVYPNLGYYTNAGWQSTDGIGGEEYAAMALRWREEGAQIIGGCCGTRPAHIAAARARLDGTAPGRRRPVEPRFASDAGSAARPAHRAQPPVVGRARAHAVSAAGARSGRRGHDGGAQPGLIPGLAAPVRARGRRGPPLPRRGLRQRAAGDPAGAQRRRHVHAIDVDPDAIRDTLANAYRNGVADCVTAAAVDLFPWVPAGALRDDRRRAGPGPVDPFQSVSSHRRSTTGAATWSIT